MTNTVPPPKAPPRPLAAPALSDAQEIAKIKGRFKDMWKKFIQPLMARADAIEETLKTNLFDQDALQDLDDEMCDAEKVIKASAGLLRAATLQKIELDGDLKAYNDQADSILAPLRLEINNTLDEKSKKLYGNDTARDDALIVKLGAVDGWPAIAKALDQTVLELALVKAETASIVGADKAARALLAGHVARLENFSARILAGATPYSRRNEE